MLPPFDAGGEEEEGSLKTLSVILLLLFKLLVSLYFVAPSTLEKSTVESMASSEGHFLLSILFPEDLE